MTPSLPRWHLRRWALGLLALLAWIPLSLAWSWFLINHAFDRDIQSRLISRTQQLTTHVHDQLQAGAPTRLGAAGNTTRPQFELESAFDLQADVESVRHDDPHIAYAMVWTEDGKVIAHSRRELFHTSLDSSFWPALEPGQSARISRLTVPALSKDPHVLEATVPLIHLGKTIAFVSIAYPQDFLDEEFWRTQRQVLIAAVGFTLAGLVLLFLVIHFTIARLDRRRREIQQTALARTSLLTERGMLASVLAHEVRSPLTALRFNLHSLRTLIANQAQGLQSLGTHPGDNPPQIDRQVELTDRCEREIRRLDGMLNDFLQRTQVIGPEGGGEPSYVNTVISEALEFLRPALERKNIRISIHLDHANPLVQVHPDELRQVILNLVANAQDAMPKGGTLAVSTVAENLPTENLPAPDSGGGPPSSADTVTILIRDSGTGIPPDLHERIFEPFFSTKPSGSGLGLALVRRVISGAGGTVSCESVAGAARGKSAQHGADSGTTFRIVLPRAQANPLQPGPGYAHIHREDPALTLDQSPELVIDLQQRTEKPEPSSPKPESDLPLSRSGACSLVNCLLNSARKMRCPMNCPKCHAPMEPVTVDQYTADRCAACSGLWFDLGEHEHIAHSKSDAKNLDTGDPARGRRQDQKRQIDCPFCHVKMLNLSVPGQPHIHYENCPVCYGAYFDAGEFKDYATYSLPEQIRTFFRNFKRKQGRTT